MINKIFARVIRQLAFLKPFFEWIVQIETRFARSWCATAHKRLYSVQWRLAPTPEFFDHHIDLFYSWLDSRNALWLERGVFGSLALKGGTTLELCCGDGFNARNFYSLRCQRIVACDYDASAIRVAKQKNFAPNIEYLKADIRTEMPSGKFDNVVWDGAIEHFTPDEIERILDEIKVRLPLDGILTGYTIVEKSDGAKSLSHHEYEFKSKEDLARFLAPHFKNITVFETVYPNRHNLYFWASDGILPFGDKWSRVLKIEQ